MEDLEHWGRGGKGWRMEMREEVWGRGGEWWKGEGEICNLMVASMIDINDNGEKEIRRDLWRILKEGGKLVEGGRRIRA